MANIVNYSPGAAFQVLPSEQRTASPDDTYEFAYPGGIQALFLAVDISATEDADSIVVTIEGVDAANGVTFPLLTSASLSSVGTVVLKVSPSLSAVANQVASDACPPRFRISVAQTGTDGLTYSVGGMVA